MVLTMIKKILIAAIYSVTISAYAFAENHFNIESFSDTTKSVPAVGNSFIIPVTSTTLQQITTPPEVLEKGHVLLRRRFSAREYGLYIGLMNPKAYSRLSAFKPSEKISISTFISRKIYSSQTDNPDLDIENVYFDGDLIYVENIASIFYHDSTWKEIRMLDVLPCRLNVTSDPPGAQVYINNEYQGITPLYLGAIYEPTAIIRLDLKGYFIAENFIDLQSGLLLEKHFELKSKPVFEDGSEIDIEAYTAENTESVFEINQRIETVRKSALKLREDSVTALEAFIANYPKMDPKDQFETTEEFENRKNEYIAKFNQEKDELKKQFNEKRTRVLSVIPRMEAYLDSIKEREYTKYFDGDLLKLSQYNADSGFFPVTMTVTEKGFVFSFGGKLYIPREEAKEFYAKGTGSGKIILIYKNWFITIPRDSIKENHYVYFTGLKLKFKDVDYDLRGTCSYPDYVENSNEYAQFIKALDIKRKQEILERQARGSVTITTKPAKVKVSVFAGPTLLGTTPLQVQLQPGNYLLSLKATDCKEMLDSLLVIKDSLVRKNYIMEYTDAYTDSIAASRNLFKKKFRLVRRIAFTSLALGFGSLGYYFETQAKSSYSDYQGLRAGSNQSEFDDCWNSFRTNSKNRNIYYALSGVSLGLFAISIPF